MLQAVIPEATPLPSERIGFYAGTARGSHPPGVYRRGTSRLREIFSSPSTPVKNRRRENFIGLYTTSMPHTSLIDELAPIRGLGDV